MEKRYTYSAINCFKSNVVLLLSIIISCSYLGVSPSMSFAGLLNLTVHLCFSFSNSFYLFSYHLFIFNLLFPISFALLLYKLPLVCRDSNLDLIKPIVLNSIKPLKILSERRFLSRESSSLFKISVNPLPPNGFLFTTLFTFFFLNIHK